MWLARDYDGCLFMYKRKPQKGFYEWYPSSKDDDEFIELDRGEWFPEVTWEDNEPTEISINQEKKL